MKGMNIPTLEEFTEAVKAGFKHGWPNLSDEEVDRYFATEEAQSVIRNGYYSDRARLEAGEITENVFKVGCVSSVAVCLIYMY